MNYEQDLNINKSELDNEWIKQPYLYMKYAEAAAYAQDKKQKVKENLEVVKAEADKRARENLTIKGEKITESKVSVEIVLDSEYKVALQDLHEANLNASIVDSAVKAMDHKKKALEKLVDLHLGGYYSQLKNPMQYEKKDDSENYTQKIVSDAHKNHFKKRSKK